MFEYFIGACIVALGIWIINPTKEDDNEKKESYRIGESFRILEKKNQEQLEKQGEVFLEMKRRIEEEIYDDSDLYEKLNEYGRETQKQENKIISLKEMLDNTREIIQGLENRISILENKKLNNTNEKENKKPTTKNKTKSRLV